MCPYSSTYNQDTRNCILCLEQLTGNDHSEVVSRNCKNYMYCRLASSGVIYYMTHARRSYDINSLKENHQEWVFYYLGYPSEVNRTLDKLVDIMTIAPSRIK